MVGDAEVLPTECLRGCGHLFEGVDAVGGDGVIVQSAAQVGGFDEIG